MSLSSTNAALLKDLESYRKSIAQVQMQTAKLTTFSAEEGPRAVRSLRQVVELEYQLETYSRSLAVIQQTAKDKRQALWEARKQAIGKKKPNSNIVTALRRVDGTEIPVDYDGRTMSEAEEEADLLGQDNRHSFPTFVAQEERSSWWRALFPWSKSDAPPAKVPHTDPRLAEESGIGRPEADLIDFSSDEEEQYQSASSGLDR